MRAFKSRTEDATFELNLAPLLDIIVSIVPMLLLSVVFVQITMVETPIPQAVQRTMANQDKKDETQITLGISKTSGFQVTVDSHGSAKQMSIGLNKNKLDYYALHIQMLMLKHQYPNSFRLELHPEENVDLKDLVAVMDKIRNRSKSDPKIYFKDSKTGKDVETDLIFPDVVFGNVAGG